MDITYGPVFHITMLLNPKLALWIISQLHPDRHPHTVKYIVNGNDDKTITIDYDERKGIMPTDEQIEKVILLFEDSLKVAPGVRGVRFDVSFQSDLAIINLEMQRTLERYIDYRMHLSSSQIMVFHTESGAKFYEVTPIYITFICIEDPYGLGLRKYTWDTYCREAPGLRQTYAPQWTVYNASGIIGDVSVYIQDLLEYLRAPDAYNVSAAVNPLIPELHAAAKRTLMDGRLRQVISSAVVRDQSLEKNSWDAGMAEGHQRGVAEGHQRGVTEGLNTGRSEALREAAIAAIEGGAEDAFVARIGKMTIEEAAALRRELESKM